MLTLAADRRAKMQLIKLLCVIALFSVTDLVIAQTTSRNLSACIGAKSENTWTNCVEEETIDIPLGFVSYVGQWQYGLNLLTSRNRASFLFISKFDKLDLGVRHRYEKHWKMEESA